MRIKKVMDKKLSAHFTLSELTKSSTAIRKGIENIPTEEALENLTKLAQNVLEKIRTEYGKPIIVSSGYRCPKLNTKIGGAKNSDHMYGAAADIRTVSDSIADNKTLFLLIVEMAKEGKIKCRQILDEYNYNWIHVSINHSKNRVKNNEVLHIK